MANKLIKRFFWTFCVALALIATNQVVCEDGYDFERNVELLCKDKLAEIRKISQVKSIIEYVKSNKETLICDPKVVASILDMEETISKDLNDVCNSEKVDNIRDYHNKYIALNPDEPNKNLLPGSLRNFFLAFGMKVSYICKKNMINSLLYDTHRMLNEQDFKTMELWTSKSGSMMNDIIGAPVDYDDLLLASDLNYLKSDGGSGPSEKLFIQTATGSLIERIQLYCERRFRPFYKKLIMPLVDLSNVGYNFQGEELERELKEMRTNKEVNQWYRMVYLCESLRDIQIVDDGNIDGTDQRVVRILTLDEAMKINEEKKSLGVQGPSETSSPTRIDYTFEGQIPIDDTVVDDNDKNLAKLINTFDAKKRETDRIRGKVFRKLGTFVTRMLKQKQVKFVTDFFKKKLFDSDPDGENSGSHAKQDMVFAIDEFVQLKTDSSDMPVAGITDYMNRIRHNSVYLGPRGVKNNVVRRSTYWVPARIFWYIFATLLFVLGLSLLISAIG